ncbi:hypothetical protein GBA52_028314 [Prunus armeniaca]|nr:hypothetical protein GBA52_028314 [Prunus armeniaca]
MIAVWILVTGNSPNEDFEELDVLLKLCDQAEEGESVGISDGMEEGYGIVEDENGGLVQCPLCGVDISDLSDEERQVHSNECLDKVEIEAQDASIPEEDQREPQVSGQVLQWLRSLGLRKDLFSIGIAALGPRKKIVHALTQLREGTTSPGIEAQPRKRSASGVETVNDASEEPVDNSKTAVNKLITDYFPGFTTARKQVCTTSGEQQRVEKRGSGSGHKGGAAKNHVTTRKLRDIPRGVAYQEHHFEWMLSNILGGIVRIDYQGLTKSFCHGKIYCSSITAKLYDFPKQEAVIQFVIDAIQAETFNPKTLFLIGSYTIGRVHCSNESQIHVVPMWTLASFKRLKHMSNQYASRFSLIVAFSPTGWTFGKGKKKSPGRRSQQGTMIRYEVPYSEHSSFTELKEFVKLISPADIVPSVNNHGPDSAKAMISLLSSESQA